MTNCGNCLIELKFGNTPTLGAGKLASGETICLDCFRKLTKLNKTSNTKKFTLVEVKTKLSSTQEATISNQQVKSETRLAPQTKIAEIETMMEEEEKRKNAHGIKCPRCGSDKISANKKGFGVGKAIVGDLLLGSVGILAGGIGSNKVFITCLSCNKQFKPGEDQYSEKVEQQQVKGMLISKFGKIFLTIFLTIIGGFMFWIGLPIWFILIFICGMGIVFLWKAYIK